MAGVDDRHRDKSGKIEERHGNTKIKNLKDQYPELKGLRNEETLATVRGRYGVDSLDALIRARRAQRTS